MPTIGEKKKFSVDYFIFDMSRWLSVRHGEKKKESEPFNISTCLKDGNHNKMELL
jgi:hypothetical protein